MNELVGRFMECTESVLESAELLYQHEQVLFLANCAYYTASVRF